MYAEQSVVLWLMRPQHDDSRPYFPPFNTGRMNISNNCCNEFELPNGRQVNLSFWW